MLLSRFPRVRLGHFPTPLEPMPNLSRSLGGPALYIKRDDCTGLATGGNKVRKLEFLVADAIAHGADTLITQGAVQSNHVRQTIAAAARCGLDCKVLLEERIADPSAEYSESGNVFLDYLLGGSIVARLPGGTDMPKAMEDLAATLRAENRKPYIIPGGGSNPIGALGYVACAQEIIAQSFESGVPVHRVVTATGSAGTQAGLVVGFAGSNTDVPVFGFSVRAARAKQEENVWNLVQATAAHAGVKESAIQRRDVVADDGFVGAGYGRPTPEMIEAVSMTAKLEGILLDPVYSGKAMAGLISAIRAGRFKSTENIVFIHTGGSAALFGYQKEFSEHKID